MPPNDAAYLAASKQAVIPRTEACKAMTFSMTFNDQNREIIGLAAAGRAPAWNKAQPNAEAVKDFARLEGLQGCEVGFGHVACQAKEPYSISRGVRAVPVWVLWRYRRPAEKGLISDLSRTH